MEKNPKLDLNVLEGIFARLGGSRLNNEEDHEIVHQQIISLIRWITHRNTRPFNILESKLLNTGRGVGNQQRNQQKALPAPPSSQIPSNLTSTNPTPASGPVSRSTLAVTSTAPTRDATSMVNAALTTAQLAGLVTSTVELPQDEETRKKLEKEKEQLLATILHEGLSNTNTINKALRIKCEPITAVPSDWDKSTDNLAATGLKSKPDSPMNQASSPKGPAGEQAGGPSSSTDTAPVAGGGKTHHPPLDKRSATQKLTQTLKLNSAATKTASNLTEAPTKTATFQDKRLDDKHWKSKLIGKTQRVEVLARNSEELVDDVLRIIGLTGDELFPPFPGEVLQHNQRASHDPNVGLSGTTTPAQTASPTPLNVTPSPSGFASANPSPKHAVAASGLAISNPNASIGSQGNMIGSPHSGVSVGSQTSATSGASPDPHYNATIRLMNRNVLLVDREVREIFRYLNALCFPRLVQTQRAKLEKIFLQEYRVSGGNDGSLVYSAGGSPVSGAAAGKFAGAGGQQQFTLQSELSLTQSQQEWVDEGIDSGALFTLEHDDLEQILWYDSEDEEESQMEFMQQKDRPSKSNRLSDSLSDSLKGSGMKKELRRSAEGKPMTSSREISKERDGNPASSGSHALAGSRALAAPSPGSKALGASNRKKLGDEFGGDKVTSGGSLGTSADGTNSFGVFVTGGGGTVVSNTSDEGGGASVGTKEEGKSPLSRPLKNSTGQMLQVSVAKNRSFNKMIAPDYTAEVYKEVSHAVQKQEIDLWDVSGNLNRDTMRFMLRHTEVLHVPSERVEPIDSIGEIEKEDEENREKDKEDRRKFEESTGLYLRGTGPRVGKSTSKESTSRVGQHAAFLRDQQTREELLTDLEEGSRLARQKTQNSSVATSNLPNSKNSKNSSANPGEMMNLVRIGGSRYFRPTMSAFRMMRAGAYKKLREAVKECGRELFPNVSPQSRESILARFLVAFIYRKIHRLASRIPVRLALSYYFRLKYFRSACALSILEQTGKMLAQYGTHMGVGQNTGKTDGIKATSNESVAGAANPTDPTQERGEEALHSKDSKGSKGSKKSVASKRSQRSTSSSGEFSDVPPKTNVNPDSLLSQIMELVNLVAPKFTERLNLPLVTSGPASWRLISLLPMMSPYPNIELRGLQNLVIPPEGANIVEDLENALVRIKNFLIGPKMKDEFIKAAQQTNPLQDRILTCISKIRQRHWTSQCPLRDPWGPVVIMNCKLEPEDLMAYEKLRKQMIKETTDKSVVPSGMQTPVSPRVSGLQTPLAQPGTPPSGRSSTALPSTAFPSAMPSIATGFPGTGPVGSVTVAFRTEGTKTTIPPDQKGSLKHASTDSLLTDNSIPLPATVNISLAPGLHHAATNMSLAPLMGKSASKEYVGASPNMTLTAANMSLAPTIMAQTSNTNMSSVSPSNFVSITHVDDDGGNNNSKTLNKFNYQSLLKGSELLNNSPYQSQFGGANSKDLGQSPDKPAPIHMPQPIPGLTGTALTVTKTLSAVRRIPSKTNTMPGKSPSMNPMPRRRGDKLMTDLALANSREHADKDKEAAIAALQDDFPMIRAPVEKELSSLSPRGDPNTLTPRRELSNRSNLLEAHSGNTTPKRQLSGRNLADVRRSSSRRDSINVHRPLAEVTKAASLRPSMNKAASARPSLRTSLNAPAAGSFPDQVVVQAVASLGGRTSRNAGNIAGPNVAYAGGASNKPPAIAGPPGSHYGSDPTDNEEDNADDDDSAYEEEIKTEVSEVMDRLTQNFAADISMKEHQEIGNQRKERQEEQELKLSTTRKNKLIARDQQGAIRDDVSLATGATDTTPTRGRTDVQSESPSKRKATPPMEGQSVEGNTPIGATSKQLVPKKDAAHSTLNIASTQRTSTNRLDSTARFSSEGFALRENQDPDLPITPMAHSLEASYASNLANTTTNQFSKSPQKMKPDPSATFSSDDSRSQPNMTNKTSEQWRDNDQGGSKATITGGGATPPRVVSALAGRANRGSTGQIIEKKPSSYYDKENKRKSAVTVSIVGNILDSDEVGEEVPASQPHRHSKSDQSRNQSLSTQKLLELPGQIPAGPLAGGNPPNSSGPIGRSGSKSQTLPLSGGLRHVGEDRKTSKDKVAGRDENERNLKASRLTDGSSTNRDTSDRRSNVTHQSSKGSASNYRGNRPRANTTGKRGSMTSIVSKVSRVSADTARSSDYQPPQTATSGFAEFLLGLQPGKQAQQSSHFMLSQQQGMGLNLFNQPPATLQGSPSFGQLSQFGGPSPVPNIFSDELSGQRSQNANQPFPPALVAGLQAGQQQSQPFTHQPSHNQIEDDWNTFDIMEHPTEFQIQEPDGTQEEAQLEDNLKVAWLSKLKAELFNVTKQRSLVKNAFGISRKLSKDKSNPNSNRASRRASAALGSSREMPERSGTASNAFLSKVVSTMSGRRLSLGVSQHSADKTETADGRFGGNIFDLKKPDQNSDLGNSAPKDGHALGGSGGTQNRQTPQTIGKPASEGLRLPPSVANSKPSSLTGSQQSSQPGPMVAQMSTHTRPMSHSTTTTTTVAQITVNQAASSNQNQLALLGDTQKKPKKPKRRIRYVDEPDEILEVPTKIAGVNQIVEDEEEFEDPDLALQFNKPVKTLRENSKTNRMLSQKEVVGILRQRVLVYRGDRAALSLQHAQHITLQKNKKTYMERELMWGCHVPNLEPLNFADVYKLGHLKSGFLMIVGLQGKESLMPPQNTSGMIVSAAANGVSQQAGGPLPEKSTSAFTNQNSKTAHGGKLQSPQAPTKHDGSQSTLQPMSSAIDAEKLARITAWQDLLELRVGDRLYVIDGVLLNQVGTMREKMELVKTRSMAVWVFSRLLRYPYGDLQNMSQQSGLNASIPPQMPNSPQVVNPYTQNLLNLVSNQEIDEKHDPFGPHMIRVRWNRSIRLGPQNQFRPFALQALADRNIMKLPDALAKSETTGTSQFVIAKRSSGGMVHVKSATSRNTPMSGAVNAHNMLEGGASGQERKGIRKAHTADEGDMQVFDIKALLESDDAVDQAKGKTLQLLNGYQRAHSTDLDISRAMSRSSEGKGLPLSGGFGPTTAVVAHHSPGGGFGPVSADRNAKNDGFGPTPGDKQSLFRGMTSFATSGPSIIDASEPEEVIEDETFTPYPDNFFVLTLEALYMPLICFLEERLDRDVDEILLRTEKASTQVVSGTTGLGRLLHFSATVPVNPSEFLCETDSEEERERESLLAKERQKEIMDKSIESAGMMGASFNPHASLGGGSIGVVNSMMQNLLPSSLVNMIGLDTSQTQNAGEKKKLGSHSSMESIEEVEELRGDNNAAKSGAKRKELTLLTFPRIKMMAFVYLGIVLNFVCTMWFAALALHPEEKSSRALFLVCAVILVSLGLANVVFQFDHTTFLKNKLWLLWRMVLPMSGLMNVAFWVVLGDLGKSTIETDDDGNLSDADALVRFPDHSLAYLVIFFLVLPHWEMTLLFYRRPEWKTGFTQFLFQCPIASKEIIQDTCNGVGKLAMGTGIVAAETVVSILCLPCRLAQASTNQNPRVRPGEVPEPTVNLVTPFGGRGGGLVAAFGVNSQGTIAGSKSTKLSSRNGMPGSKNTPPSPGESDSAEEWQRQQKRLLLQVMRRTMKLGLLDLLAAFISLAWLHVDLFLLMPDDDGSLTVLRMAGYFFVQKIFAIIIHTARTVPGGLNTVRAYHYVPLAVSSHTAILNVMCLLLVCRNVLSLILFLILDWCCFTLRYHTFMAELATQIELKRIQANMHDVKMLSENTEHNSGSPSQKNALSLSAGSQDMMNTSRASSAALLNTTLNNTTLNSAAILNTTLNSAQIKRTSSSTSTSRNSARFSAVSDDEAAIIMMRGQMNADGTVAGQPPISTNRMIVQLLQREAKQKWREQNRKAKLKQRENDPLNSYDDEDEEVEVEHIALMDYLRMILIIIYRFGRMEPTVGMNIRIDQAGAWNWLSEQLVRTAILFGFIVLGLISDGAEPSYVREPGSDDQNANYFLVPVPDYQHPLGIIKFLFYLHDEALPFLIVTTVQAIMQDAMTHNFVTRAVETTFTRHLGGRYSDGFRLILTTMTFNVVLVIFVTSMVAASMEAKGPFKF